MAISSGITVPGTAGGVVTVSPGTGDSLNLAQQMATVLAGINAGGGLTVTSAAAGSSVPTTGGAGQTELIIAGAGGVGTTVPAGNNFVVNVSTSPDTVRASNTNFMTGD